jgi:hypothetical protein
MIAAPPLLDGADQDNTTEPLLQMAVTLLGIPGRSLMTTVTEALAADDPAVLSAFTV